MSSMQDAVDELVLDFETLDDWEHRYEYIIDLGKDLPDYPEEWMCEPYEVYGCQSRVWIHPRLEDGKLIYEGTSDALIVRGLVALILKVYSGHAPEDILAYPPAFVQKLGLETHLMSTRVNGLKELIKRVFQYAEAARSQGIL